MQLFGRSLMMKPGASLELSWGLRFRLRVQGLFGLIGVKV